MHGLQDFFFTSSSLDPFVVWFTMHVSQYFQNNGLCSNNEPPF
jgi:hypothetical protein